MLFLDCTDWCAAHNTTIDQLEKAGWDVGVAWQDGRAFHGPCHIPVSYTHLDVERNVAAEYGMNQQL